MNSLELEFYDVSCLTLEDSQNLNGGILPFIIIGGLALIASSCNVGNGNANVEVVGSNNHVTVGTKADSSSNSTDTRVRASAK